MRESEGKSIMVSSFLLRAGATQTCWVSKQA